MVMLRLTAEQYKKLPILAKEGTFSGKTYIITGGNSGLGLETARHLVEFSAERVILAVRNLEAGENAKRDIETSTRRKGVVDVWHIDMASHSSVQNFAKRASTELDRIDGLVANAGILLDTWSTSEGMETTIAVNVINTLLLGTLIMPKLVESKRKFDIQPTLVFIVSVFGYTSKAEMDKHREGNIFSNLNDEKLTNMGQRYPLSKLIEEFAVRQLAALCPVERTGVTVTMVAPGLCSTSLGRDSGMFAKLVHETYRVMMARTAEVGSRTFLHGLVVGPEGHGKLLSGCKIKEYWVPDWVSNADGQNLQKRVWKELVARLEEVEPGCVSQLSQI